MATKLMTMRVEEISLHEKIDILNAIFCILDIKHRCMSKKIFKKSINYFYKIQNLF